MDDDYSDDDYDDNIDNKNNVNKLSFDDTSIDYILSMIDKDINLMDHFDFNSIINSSQFIKNKIIHSILDKKSTNNYDIFKQINNILMMSYNNKNNINELITCFESYENNIDTSIVNILIKYPSFVKNKIVDKFNLTQITVTILFDNLKEIYINHKNKYIYLIKKIIYDKYYLSDINIISLLLYFKICYINEFIECGLKINQNHIDSFFDNINEIEISSTFNEDVITDIINFAIKNNLLIRKDTLVKILKTKTQYNYDKFEILTDLLIKNKCEITDKLIYSFENKKKKLFKILEKYIKNKKPPIKINHKYKESNPTQDNLTKLLELCKQPNKYFEIRLLCKQIKPTIECLRHVCKIPNNFKTIEMFLSLGLVLDDICLLNIMENTKSSSKTNLPKIIEIYKYQHNIQ